MPAAARRPSRSSSERRPALCPPSKTSAASAPPPPARAARASPRRSPATPALPGESKAPPQAGLDAGLPPPPARPPSPIGRTSAADWPTDRHAARAPHCRSPGPHEDRQYRRDGRGRRPDDQSQLAHPADLKHQGRATRDEQHQGHHAQARSLRRCGRRWLVPPRGVTTLSLRRSQWLPSTAQMKPPAEPSCAIPGKFVDRRPVR